MQDPERPTRFPDDEPRAALHEALYEIKRVIVGQDAMLERLLVSLLVGGHVLLEGVPGLAKTLTVKTLSAVLGGSYGRIQFTPDLGPADLVGTRGDRPGSGRGGCGAGRPRGDRVRGRDRGHDPQPGRAWAGRDRAPDRFRREPARADRARPGRSRPRAAARAGLRGVGRHPRSRGRRAAPPA